MLRAEDFAPYFTQINGYPPFSWQVELVEYGLAHGRLPDVLDLPTGSGKTSLIEIAVFLLAAQPETFARRIVFVVDRRIIVDQTYQHVDKIAGALKAALDAGPSEDATYRVGAELDRLSDGAELLVTARLRGGERSGSEWAHWPDQPTVIVSTVDQFGSRLLFRGYGVSRTMRPVHAGLTGNDCLVILDEVHIARPAAETFGACSQLDLVRQLPRRWQLVQMSATPVNSTSRPFSLPPVAELPPSDIVLRTRLSSIKNTRLVELKGTDVGVELPKKIKSLLADLPEDALLVGVFVNRVRSARNVAAAIENLGLRTHLVTGRMRPADRSAVMEQVIAAGDPDRSVALTERTVIVATQTIEVGADISVDALITEAAPLSALKQRFGRLDRRGTRSAAGVSVEAMVLGFPAALKREDPVYGTAARATWEALQDRFGTEPFDGGPLSRDWETGADDVEPEPLLASLLLPSHLEALVQTNPAPHSEPVIADFLHGVEDATAEVALVWRDDLNLVDTGRDDAIRALRLVPPVAGEELPVPVAAVLAWLNGKDEIPVADVSSGSESITTDGGGQKVLRVRGTEVEVVTASRETIQAGDVMVLPSSAGGVTKGTWDPTSTEPVADLHTTIWDELYHADLALPPRRVHLPSTYVAGKTSSDEMLQQWLSSDDPLAVAISNRFGARPRWESYQYESEGAVKQVVWVARPAPASQSGLALDGADEGNSAAQRVVSLDSHLSGVGARASGFGNRCGLPQAITDDLELAGQLHDLGKADIRFQAKLRGSEMAAYAADELVAKGPWSRQSFGYPRGARHEFMSLELLQEYSAVLEQAHDPELVQHLVSSHHGHARPWPVVVADTDPVAVDVNWKGHRLEGHSDLPSVAVGPEVVERFWRLNDRYGPHGLAWLECLVRLADHRQSESEAD